MMNGSGFFFFFFLKGKFLSLIKMIQMQMSVKHKGLRCSQGMMSKAPPATVVDVICNEGRTFAFLL